MLHADPLMKRVSEIIDRVVEAGIYNYWISLNMNLRKLYSRKSAIVHPLDGYYSFNLYHMQPAFYLLLMGWCLSVFCFMFETLYNRFLAKEKEVDVGWFASYFSNMARVPQDFFIHKSPAISLTSCHRVI